MNMINELIQKLRHYAEEYKNPPYGREICGTKELLIQSADAIEELSVKVEQQKQQNMEKSSQYYHGGWIPVNECMPKEYDSIFAKFKGTEKWVNGMAEKISDDVNVTVEYENKAKKVKTLHTCDGKWQIGNSLLGFKVIAWQPLPTAYEPKED